MFQNVHNLLSYSDVQSILLSSSRLLSFCNLQKNNFLTLIFFECYSYIIYIYKDLKTHSYKIIFASLQYR